MPLKSTIRPRVASGSASPWSRRERWLVSNQIEIIWIRILRPFTYRKYLDFGAIEALRDLKKAIDREFSARACRAILNSVPGGIREVEFITQAFQLIRGGRNSDLQTQSLYQALQQLAADQVLTAEDVDGLWNAYIFLRNTEHALQGIADKQTQKLPADELGKQRVATILGCDNWQALIRACNSIASM